MQSKEKIRETSHDFGEVAICNLSQEIQHIKKGKIKLSLNIPLFYIGTGRGKKRIKGKKGKIIYKEEKETKTLNGMVALLM